MNMDKLEHIIVNGTNYVGEYEETKDAIVVKNAIQQSTFDAKPHLCNEALGKLENITTNKATPVSRKALTPEEKLNAVTQQGKFTLAETLYMKQALVDFFLRY